MKTVSIFSAILPLAFRSFTAFDPGSPSWKKDADGKLVIGADGNPIYVNSDGREMSVSFTTISTLNAEAKANRERAETAENNLKAFSGIDPAQLPEMKKALETVKKIDQNKLIESGELEKVRKEITDSFQSKLDSLTKANESLLQNNRNLQLESEFARSKFIGERVAVPVDMFKATFRNNFSFDENGKIVPKYPDGNVVYSQTRMGEIASVDEALQLIVDKHPDKDQILRAPGKGGSNNSGGSNFNGKVVKSRTDFNTLQPIEQAQFMQTVREGKAELVD